MTCRIAHKLCLGLLVCFSAATQAASINNTEYGYYNLRDDSQEIYHVELTESQDGKQLEINMADSTQFRFHGAVLHCKQPSSIADGRHVFMIKQMYYQPDSEPHIADIGINFLTNRQLPMWVYPTEDKQQIVVGQNLKLILIIGEDLPSLPQQSCSGVNEPT